MSVIGSNILAGASGQGGGYNLTRSLRFRQSASGHLTRTPASETNRKTWTWSGWVKWSLLDISNSYNSALFTGSNTGDGIMFWTNPNTLGVLNVYLGGANYYVNTTQVFRDPSAWYHIVVAIDTTQATSTNRIKLYVNGSQITSFSSSNYPTQNYDTNVNTTGTHYIGRQNSLSRYFDGYLTEVNFIDGQALTPSSFGATSSTTGVWQPKRYSGTYGTNGFYLPFTDNSALTSGSNAGLGKDFSGNGNYWNTNNISITSGSTYDSMTDVPTLTSATTANYAVLNPLSKGANATLSNANLSWAAAQMVGGNHQAITSIAMSSGKWYCEFTPQGSEANGCIFGLVSEASVTGVFPGATTTSYGYAGFNGNKYNSGASAYGATFTLGDIVGIAFDADAGTLTFYKNGTSQGTAFSSIPTGSYYFGVGNNSSLTVLQASFNAGQRPFSYTPPTGYVALNTFNLPTPTIGATASSQANKYMDISLYTGNGTTQTITNSGSMQPDLVWIKGRNYAQFHDLTDSVRGGTKVLSSNSTAAEVTDANNITSFNSNGFSIGSSAYLNTDTATFVGWQWKANGTGVTNTAGSITSTVSANTTSGFSVVTYTGNGSAGATVGHGLGVAPKMIIVKCRNSGVAHDWRVYHASLGATKNLQLNLTDAAQTTSATWNNTSPSSTVFTLGSGGATNESGTNLVAYCFAEVAGYSKAFSYTGNGSDDGVYVNLGFRPRWIMIKRSDSTGTWWVFDTARSTYNVVNNELYPNTSQAEGTGVSRIDMLSNGFKLRTGSEAQINGSGGTYIGFAVAENPFKYSLGK